MRQSFTDAGVERTVLSHILQDFDRYVEASALLNESDFLARNNREIYSIAVRLYQSGFRHLCASDILNYAENHCFGEPYAKILFDADVSHKDFSNHLKRLLEASAKYRLYSVIDEARSEIVKNARHGKNTEELADRLQRRVLEAAFERSSSDGVVDLGSGLQELLDSRRAVDGFVTGLGTGFRYLDERINGLQPGTLTVVAARPKIGKSAFLLNIARHIAFKENKSVLYIDTEMLPEEQMSRLLAMMSFVRERDVGRTAEGSQEDQWVKAAKQKMEAHPYRIYHRYIPHFRMEMLGGLARRYKVQRDIGAIIFDYIKLPEGGLSSNVLEYQQLGYLTVELKAIAGDLNIPVITAAQLNRSAAELDRVYTAMVADSDRVVRYANTLLALCPKGSEQIETEHVQAGNYRLQILETRAGGEFGTGINLVFLKDYLLMIEAEEQPGELTGKDKFEDFRPVWNKWAMENLNNEWEWFGDNQQVHSVGGVVGS